MSYIRKVSEKDKKTGPLLVGFKEKLKKSQLTDGQRKAFEAFDNWWRHKDKERKQIFRIGGEGGSGKSWLIRFIIEHYNFTESNCYVMAYTGQATNVLRQSGIMAKTIHSTVMVPREEPVFDKKTHHPIYRNGIPLTTVKFKPLKRLPKGIKLLIVDEASFLPENLETVLKNFGIPILEVGDPIQLPPVGDDRQVFHLRNLDYLITGRNMRQDMNSELYDFTSRFRRLENIDTRKYHDDVLFLYAQPTIEETFWKFYPFFKSANVIVVAENKQRQVINDMYRRHILKADSPFPVEGERMICRRNNYALSLGPYNLVNGTQGTCLRDVGRSMVDKGNRVFYMDFQPFTSTDPDEYYDNLICDTDYLQHPFGVDSFNYYKPGEKFEYAHAITTHLMQGAQEDTILFMDSFRGNPEYLWRLRYTAATRAKKRLIYIIPYSTIPGWSDIRTMGDNLGPILGDLVR